MGRAAWFVLVAVVVSGCGGGGGDRLSGRLPQATSHLSVSSPSFTNSARLPRRYTCDGAGEEPVVRVGARPPGTREVVMIVSDPDAPGGTFVHLTRYAGHTEGLNSTGKPGWTPPCPPKGDRPHHYVWSAYALGSPSGLKARATPDDVAKAVRRRPLASGSITARYGR